MTQSTGLPHYFSGFIQEGKIFAQSYEGTTQIGYTLKEFSDLQKRHEELVQSYNEYQEFILTHQTAMVKAGIIEQVVINTPLSPEEVVKRQAEQMEQMQQVLLQNQQVMLQMQNQLQSLVGVTHGHNGNHPAGGWGQAETSGSHDGSGPDGLGSGKDAELETRVSEVRPAKQRKAK